MHWTNDQVAYLLIGIHVFLFVLNSYKNMQASSTREVFCEWIIDDLRYNDYLIDDLEVQYCEKANDLFSSSQ